MPVEDEIGLMETISLPNKGEELTGCKAAVHATRRFLASTGNPQAILKLDLKLIAHAVEERTTSALVYTVHSSLSSFLVLHASHTHTTSTCSLPALFIYPLSAKECLEKSCTL